MLTDCYYQLDHLPLLDTKYVNEGIHAEFQLPVEEINGIRTPRTIKATTTFVESTFAQDIRQQLSPNIHACFFRNNPRSLYDWHTDSTGKRKCAINFLLTESLGAMTLFRDPISRLNYNIVECPYQLYKPVLLNVDREHCVINNSDQYRYVLSVSLPDVTFDQAVEFFQTYSINSY